MNIRRALPVLLLAVIVAGISSAAFAQEIINGADLVTKLGTSSATTVERMRVTNAGLVGIGITPTQNLEVSGTVSATHFIGDGSGLTGIAGGSGSDNITSGTTNVTANIAGYINFTTGTEKMRITNAGNVGIGTTAPSNSLSVSTSTVGDGINIMSPNQTSVGLSVSNTAGQGTFGISGGVNNYANGVIPGDIVVRSLQSGTNTGNLIIAALTTSGSISFRTGALAADTEKMRIANAGYVGIGNSNPLVPLSVSQSNVSLEFSGSAAAGYNGGIIEAIDRTGTGRSDLNLYTTKALKLFSGATEVVRVSTTGVGIGGMPSYPLDVSGTTRSVAAYTNNTATYGGIFANNATTTANGTYANTGLYTQAYSMVSSGITNSGNLIGHNINSFNQSNGNLTSLYGINLSFGSSTGTGTITNEYGIVLTSYQNSGTTTNGYGVFIQDIKATNGYGIYQTGTDDKNYLAGNLGIGNIPASNLDVSGSAVIRGVLGIGQPGGSEGGQIALGYIGVVPTAQQSSTWNLDVDGSNQFRIFRQNASNVALVALSISETTGAITAPAYYQSSDARLKDNIQTSSGLAVVDKLRGVTFDWKATGKPSAGVIAQEVEKVLPNAVANDEKGIKSVNYDQLIAPLIEAVKELHRQVDKQAGQIRVLQAGNDNLRAMLEANRKPIR
jgi:hypothetical protein